MTTPADEPLRLDMFEDRIGESFAAQSEGAVHNLTLIAVEVLAGSPRPDGGFRLEFEGAQPVLPQAIYGFEVDGAIREIFIAPQGDAGGKAQYQAVFF